ncbi:hypothetical protein MMC13_007329 [Lambiella insularis]|nr:hypothetical protein [Lambiella insularis]
MSATREDKGKASGKPAPKKMHSLPTFFLTGRTLRQPRKYREMKAMVAAARMGRKSATSDLAGEASNATQETSGSTGEASGATQETSGSTGEASGATQETSDSTGEASGTTQEEPLEVVREEVTPANNEETSVAVPQEASPANAEDPWGAVSEETWGAVPEDNSTTNPGDTWADAPETQADAPEKTTAADAEGTSPAATEGGVDAAATGHPETDAMPAKETKTASDWTEEDDQKLLDLKAAKTSWKQIGTAFAGKKSIKELKVQYKQLSTGSSQVSTTTPAGDDKQNDENKQIEEASPPAGNNEQAPMQPALRLSDGTELTLRDMMYLGRLHEHYENLKWLSVTSKFLDRTDKFIDHNLLRNTIGDPNPFLQPNHPN